MNILFVSHTGGVGGAETVLLDAIKAVSENTSHNIFIALPNDGNSAFENRLEGIECKVERFAYRPIRNTMLLLVRNIGYGMLLGLPKLKRYIKNNTIDLVYVNSSVNVIGMLAAGATKRPTVWHIHEQSNDNHRWAPKWFNKYYREWFSKCQKTIFVSKTTQQMWLQDLGVSGIPNSEVLYSPYKEIKPTEKHNPQFTMGYIGSLNKNKNIETLIKAIVEVENCRLIIGGSGEYESKLKAIQTDNVEFLGRVNNLQDFYTKVDCLVLPSLNESWGLVVLEAMSAGVPVVCTKNTGLTELFTNQRECIFVDPLNTSEIAEAMTKVKNDPQFRQMMIENAAKRLEELNMNNNFTTKIIEIINGTRN